MGRNKNLPNEIKWKAVFYIRLSKEDGNDVSLSVENQKEMLNNYLLNSDEDIELVEIYVDDGRTGTDSERPDFKRMLADIHDKRFNCIIVKDTSRLSRNYAEAGLYMEQVFVEHNIRFISLHLPTLDSYLRPDEISSIATAMQNVINDDFCRQTSTKIRGVFNVKRSNGLFIGAFAPYGYLKNPDDRHSFIIDENVAPVVKDIFKWFLEGIAKTAIAMRLNDMAILCPSAYKKSIGLNYKNPHDKFETTLWSARTIDSILRNQMYIGDMIQGRGKIKSYKIHKLVRVSEDEWFVVKNRHAPIVSQETFDKTQVLLNRDIKIVSSEHEPNLFSGLIRCADCKKALHLGRTGKYVYYSCRTYKSQSKSACSKHSIREDFLKEIVLTAINAQLSVVENIEQLISEIEQAPTTRNALAQINKAIKAKEAEIDRTNHIRDGLYIDWKSNIISREDYFRLKKKHDEKINSIRENLITLRNQLHTIQSELSVDTPYFQFYKKFKHVDKLERSLVLELIDTIYIGENKEVQINFCFSDQQKQILQLVELQQSQNQKTKKFVL